MFNKIQNTPVRLPETFIFGKLHIFIIHYLEVKGIIKDSISYRLLYYIRFFLLILIVGLTCVRPQLSSLQHEPDLEWRTIKSEHFFIHFPIGYESVASKVSTLCEEVYYPISKSLNYYPGPTHVVIQTRTDFPDGVVSNLPWRMELFITEPQANIIGSRADWLKILITHEFTHIVQLRKRKGLSSLTYPFLGDYNAIWGQITPRWFLEGYAILNETRFTTGGRGRNAYHWMQFAAPVHKGNPWRLYNTNFSSRKKVPQKNMKYVTGYYLTNYIARQNKPEIWSKILDSYTRFPIIGFNRSIKSETGKNSITLYNELLSQFEVDSSEKNDNNPGNFWRLSKFPEDQYSPRWIDKDNIMVYRKSYDDLQEISIINRSGTVRRIEQRMLAKINNGFSIGKELLVTSELFPHLRFSATVYSDLKLYDLTTKKERLLTHNARVYCPDLSPDKSQVVAVQTALPTTNLIKVSLNNGKIDTLLNIPNGTILNPRWSPDGQWIAFALKDRSNRQNIAIINSQTLQWRYLYTPDNNHDNNPCWTPDGRFVLFASDRSGVYNIWAVDIYSGRRWMVTNSDLGAFTPDVSPQGNELAYSAYTNNGFKLATISLDSSSWTSENNIHYTNNLPHTENISPSDNNIKISNSKITDYQPWKQIFKPQGWFPFLFRSEAGTSLGLFASSEDALHRHYWRGILGFPINNLPFTASVYYTYRRWWLVPDIKLFSLPERVLSQGGAIWRRIQGIELSLSLPLTLEKNVYQTYFRPYLSLVKHTRYYPEQNNFQRNEKYNGIQLGFNFSRASRTIRDIVPHKAIFFTAFMDWSNPVMGSDYSASQFTGVLKTYLPTFIAHHKLEITEQYKKRAGDFFYAAAGSTPIGYGDDYKRNQLRIKLAYILPLAYLEFPIPLLPVFADYINATIFYDWGTGWDNEINRKRIIPQAKYSKGIQITVMNYIFQKFKFRLGMIVYYRSVDHSWQSSALIDYYL